MANLDYLKSTLSYLLEPPYAYLAALAGTLLLLLLAIRKYRRSHRPIVPFKTSGGTIEIAPQTLRGVMQGAAQSVEGVHKCTCRHFLRRGQLGVKVTLQMQANHSLRDIDAAIKERIRATLMEQFGMETVAPIHVRVSRIVGKPIPQERYTALAPGLSPRPDAGSGDDPAGLATPTSEPTPRPEQSRP